MFFSQVGARPKTWEASPSEHKRWVEVFKVCDEDNKGYLSREDFKVAVVMLFGYKPSKIEANAVMSSVNPNTSGISLEEFLNIVRKKKEAQVYWNETRHIFTAFDRYYRGYLTLEDFQKAFRQVAPKLPERSVLEVFRWGLRDQPFLLDNSDSNSYQWTRQWRTTLHVDLSHEQLLSKCHVRGSEKGSIGATNQAATVSWSDHGEVDQDSDGHVSFKDFEYAMNCGQK